MTEVGWVHLHNKMKMAWSLTKIDDHTLGFNVKKSGKVSTCPADGKSRTVTVSGTDPTGKKFISTAVYDKR